MRHGRNGRLVNGAAAMQGFSQRQNIATAQTLSPQMRQSLRMLQMTSVELAAELRTAMQENPVIEEVRDPRETPLSSVAPDETSGKSAADGDVALDFTPDGAAAERILGAKDGHLDYFMGNLESASGDEDAATRRQRLFDSQSSIETLQEHLLAQVPLSGLDGEDRNLAEILISNIEDSGRFAGSYPDIRMATGASEARLEAVRRRILKFDPAGCGWRDPRECLLAQMDRLDDSPWEGEVRRIVAHHLPDVAAKRYDTVRKALGLSQEELEKVLAALRTLDPYPGRDRRFAPATDRAEFVRPEVYTVFEDGRWTAATEDRVLPDIRISPRYLKMLEDPECPAEAKSYVRERIRAAEALSSAVARRQETIRAIAQAIVDAQPGFFAKGPSALRPLVMRTVAEKTGVHETTVSRTVRGKYMSTPYGTVEMRKFFAAGISSDGGGEVAVASVKERIRALVESENPSRPMSDEAIAAALKSQGVGIARRTVAKYRGELGIPGASGRRSAVSGRTGV